MANYTGDKRPDELDALTSLADTDVLVAFDADDADGKTKKITKANLLADFSSATRTATNLTLDADNNTVSNIGDAEVKNDINANKIGAGTLLHERGGLEADVSAYSGLVKISGGATSQAVENTDYAAATHASRHLTGGADEIDGDKLDIDFNPSNYTPSTTPAEADNADNLTAHLYGIDQVLANVSANSIFLTGVMRTQINNSTVDRYMATGNVDATSNTYRIPLPAGTLKNLRIYANSVTVGGTDTVNIYAQKNGTNTSITVQINNGDSGATNKSDTSNTASFSANDEFNMFFDITSSDGTTQIENIGWSIEFIPS